MGDEFLLHSFQGHLTACICEHFGIEYPEAEIPHHRTEKWLKSTSASVVAASIMPTTSVVPCYAFHRSFMRFGFKYADLRDAFQFEDGPHIVRRWKYWLLCFLGSSRKNYTLETAKMLCNIQAVLPPHLAYIATHNRMVNTTGNEGQGKPIDQVMEHYNL